MYAVDDKLSIALPSGEQQWQVVIVQGSTQPVPANLSAAADGAASIALNWDAAPETAEGYNVYRSNSANGVFARVNTEPVTVASFKDTELSPGTTYYYMVTAVYEAGESAASQVSSAETPLLHSPDSTGAPGKPVLSHNNGHDTGLFDGNYAVAMNMWWGNNGRLFSLYENDVLIDQQVLTEASPTEQATVTSIAFKPNGVYRYVAELTNAFGTTRSDELVVTVSHAKPTSPVLSHNNWLHGSDYTVTMNQWWGTNGTTYRLYENDVLIDTQSLQDDTPNAQTAVTRIGAQAPGTYVYRAELANYAGTTQSEEIVVRVDG